MPLTTRTRIRLIAMIILRGDFLGLSIGGGCRINRISHCAGGPVRLKWLRLGVQAIAESVRRCRIYLLILLIVIHDLSIA